MSSDSVRACFFDASALVKLCVDEPSSDEVRAFFSSEATKYTTSFCFYEALNILKSKWRNQGKLSRNEYLNTCFRLTTWFASTDRWVKNLEITDAVALGKACDLAVKHELDMSDALQLITVKEGYFSRCCAGSKTVFVTADKKLADVALKDHGLLVWCVLEQPPPQ